MRLRHAITCSSVLHHCSSSFSCCIPCTQDVRSVFFLFCRMQHLRPSDPRRRHSMRSCRLQPIQSKHRRPPATVSGTEQIYVPPFESGISLSLDLPTGDTVHVVSFRALWKMSIAPVPKCTILIKLIDSTGDEVFIGDQKLLHSSLDRHITTVQLKTTHLNEAFKHFACVSPSDVPSNHNDDEFAGLFRLRTSFSIPQISVATARTSVLWCKRATIEILYGIRDFLYGFLNQEVIDADSDIASVSTHASDSSFLSL